MYSLRAKCGRRSKQLRMWRFVGVCQAQNLDKTWRAVLQRVVWRRSSLTWCPGSFSMTSIGRIYSPTRALWISITSSSSKNTRMFNTRTTCITLIIFHSNRNFESDHLSGLFLDLVFQSALIESALMVSPCLISEPSHSAPPGGKEATRHRTSPCRHCDGQSRILRVRTEVTLYTLHPRALLIWLW